MGFENWKKKKNDRAVTDDPEEIIREINRFYSSLFRADQVSDLADRDIQWHPISAESSRDLIAPFSEREIKTTLFSLARDKSPSADRFSLAFYQDMWEVLKPDIISVFSDFWYNGVINQSANETHLCLIPKKMESRKVADFRPISLISSMYKLISKVFCNRIREIMW